MSHACANPAIIRIFSVIALAPCLLLALLVLPDKDIGISHVRLRHPLVVLGWPTLPFHKVLDFAFPLSCTKNLLDFVLLLVFHEFCKRVLVEKRAIPCVVRFQFRDMKG